MENQINEYPQREILRKSGRYTMCQVMTFWASPDDCPKYIACNDLERRETFVANRALGTWCEVDIISFVNRINKQRKALEVIKDYIKDQSDVTLIKIIDEALI